MWLSICLHAPNVISIHRGMEFSIFGYPKNRKTHVAANVHTNEEWDGDKDLGSVWEANQA